jgi:hypothetical protein
MLGAFRERRRTYSDIRGGLGDADKGAVSCPPAPERASRGAAGFPVGASRRAELPLPAGSGPSGRPRAGLQFP